MAVLEFGAVSFSVFFFMCLEGLIRQQHLADDLGRNFFFFCFFQLEVLEVTKNYLGLCCFILVGDVTLEVVPGDY